MAKLYHKVSGPTGEPTPPDELLASIQTFLGSCRRPAVLEYGEETMPLRPGEHELEVRSGRVWIDVRHENRSLSRHILSIEQRAPGVLDCTIQRFGGVPGKLSFLDLDRPQVAHKVLSGSRHSFAEQFRRMLFRQFPGWEIASLSSEMDLRRSFSPVFPRARLKRGKQQIAAIACPDSRDETALLTFALLWLDHLSAGSRRSSGNKASLTRLCLFLPEEAGCLTANRLRWLNGSALNASLFRFNAHGSAGEVDPLDLGNLETRVSPRVMPTQLTSEVSDLIGRLKLFESVDGCPELDGSLSVRMRGVEFARIERGRVLLGIGSKQPIHSSCFGRVEQFAAELQSIHGQASHSPLDGAPERWLESVIRSKLTSIDPSLRETPLHGQVLTFAATDRDLIDLLAVSYSGVLTVIELKTGEDIQLPMQALDYWMRIMWHAQRGELSHLFPGISLSASPPRLLLVAPAISFHSANATVLRYFSPEIDVERVGINSDWQRDLKVVLRLRGADEPQSHENSYEHPGFTPH